MKPTVIDVLENALYHFSNPDEPGRLSNYICNHITSENNPFYYSITNGDVTYKAQQLLHKYRPTPELFPEIYNHPCFTQDYLNKLTGTVKYNAFWYVPLQEEEVDKLKIVFAEKAKFLQLLIDKLKTEL